MKCDLIELYRINKRIDSNSLRKRSIEVLQMQKIGGGRKKILFDQSLFKDRKNCSTYDSN